MSSIVVFCNIVFIRHPASSLFLLLDHQKLLDGVLEAVIKAIVLDTQILLGLGRIQAEHLVIQVLSGLAFCCSVLDFGELFSNQIDNVLVVIGLNKSS